MSDTRNEEIKIIKFVAKDLPQWSVNHFLQETTSSYLKLFTLRKILELFHKGAEDSDFIIGTFSYDLFPKGNPFYESNEKYVYLTSKDESAESFWHYFKFLKRPIVFCRYRNHQTFSPLYDYESDHAIVLRNFSISSPLEISLRGTVDTLLDLFRGHLLAARDNEHIRQSLSNLRNIIELSQLIERVDTPAGVKIFARDQLETIIRHQSRINDELGINRFRLD